MKTLSRLLLSTALVFVTATAASAYSLSPPDISARLKGTLTFSPNEGGNPQPFTCKVVLDLKTKGAGKITSIKFPTGNCEGINFQHLPWGIGLTGTNGGEFSFGSFGSANGNCVADVNNFIVNSSGVWTLTGPCLSGTLKSTPPVTIVP
jgi:hypothetical protein